MIMEKKATVYLKLKFTSSVVTFNPFFDGFSAASSHPSHHFAFILYPFSDALLFSFPTSVIFPPISLSPFPSSTTLPPLSALCALRSISSPQLYDLGSPADSQSSSPGCLTTDSSCVNMGYPSCGHRGRCHGEWGSFSCQCVPGYTGHQCEEGKPERGFIFFCFSTSKTEAQVWLEQSTDLKMTLKLDFIYKPQYRNETTQRKNNLIIADSKNMQTQVLQKY